MLYPLLANIFGFTLFFGAVLLTRATDRGAAAGAPVQMGEEHGVGRAGMMEALAMGQLRSLRMDLLRADLHRHGDLCGSGEEAANTDVQRDCGPS